MASWLIYGDAPLLLLFKLFVRTTWIQSYQCVQIHKSYYIHAERTGLLASQTAVDFAECGARLLADASQHSDNDYRYENQKQGVFNQCLSFFAFEGADEFYIQCGEVIHG